MLDLVEHTNYEIMWFIILFFIMGMMLGNAITNVVARHYQDKAANAVDATGKPRMTRSDHMAVFINENPSLSTADKAGAAMLIHEYKKATDDITNDDALDRWFMEQKASRQRTRDMLKRLEIKSQLQSN